ncbi:MAG: hypothetical protein IJ410_08845 [Oscillospiraceae bacterium]|nr:hypothetical protein [Oscillospiraceae bacterium]
MYEKFEKWLDGALELEIPETAVALNFNIYEDGDDWWAVELVACDRFDVNDRDWACDEVFATRDEPFEWQEATEWQTIMENVTGWVAKYLAGGLHADTARKYDGVGCGFVDGDIEIMYIKE